MCTREDFAGFEKFYDKNANFLLCPNDPNNLFLQGHIDDNSGLKSSFAVKKCSSSLTRKCKTDEEIKKWLNNKYVTLHTI